MYMNKKFKTEILLKILASVTNPVLMSQEFNMKSTTEVFSCSDTDCNI